MPVVLKRYCAGKHSEEEIQALINEAMGDRPRRGRKGCIGCFTWSSDRNVGSTGQDMSRAINGDMC